VKGAHMLNPTATELALINIFIIVLILLGVCRSTYRLLG
jgi:hypothetical protein